MAIRSNHYDVAFEELLREMRRPYVAVDERRRALAQEASLKSFDFVVYSPRGSNLLVDVKGRRFPTASHCWENWASQEDIDSLLQWEQVFGENFRSLLLFTYELTEPRWWSRHSLVWEFRQRKYAFYGVWVRDYAAAMTQRSAKWDTVTLPAAQFRQLRKEVFDVL
ncbi:MAG: HYExAFE family protein [Planctomycetaceae bacterium]|nr:HYExAFE family protein [Planctomycetaceae bacterium]